MKKIQTATAAKAAMESVVRYFAVTLAPRDVFERQGVERSAFLGNLTFKVTRAANGEAQVEVHSTQPVTEPFLTFLVAIDWPRGHLVREYTLMLDPPVFEARPSVPAAVLAPVPANATTASVRPEPIISDAIRRVSNYRVHASGIHAAHVFAVKPIAALRR